MANGKSQIVNRKRRIGVGIVAILSLLFAPSVVAAGGITVVENAASYSFAQQATFTLRATSDADITQVYLFFQAAGEERTESIHTTVTPAREVAINYIHDLRLSPLPPFATITFWWQIDDAAGNRLTTDLQSFEYTDNRFQWEELGANGVTVRWIQGHGDPAFGQAALDIAHASVTDINAELQAALPPSITVFMYDAQRNLDAAMVLAGRRWIAAQAHPELGVAVVAIPFEEGYTSRMERTIAHEITHLLVYQAVTLAGYQYVPEWLDEGLATANERLPNPDYRVTIDEARQAGQLIPLQDLCVPFSPDPHTAFLSYAESGSVVGYIRQQYGAPAIRALLAAYAIGDSCTAGVQEALNVSLNGLDTAWQTSLAPQAPWQAWASQIGVWVGLWLLSLLVAIPMLGRIRRR